MRSMILLVALGVSASADNWAQWRGPSQSGATAKSGPAKVAEADLAWKTALPGRGCSTPVVWDGTIYLTAPIQGRDGLLAYDMAGEELWRLDFGESRPGRGQRVGSAANSSPTTDGEVLVAYFKSGNLVGTSLDGSKKWQLNVFDRFGEDKLWWDVGTSPVLVGDLVVVAVMQTEGESFLVALDKHSGEQVWKTEREFETGEESGDAYTTPLVVGEPGAETIVCWGADHLTGHRAKDGKLLWTCGGFNPERDKYQRVIASAALADGHALVPFRRGEKVAAVALDGSGDVTGSAVKWTTSGVGTDAATPVVHEGRAYVLSDSGKQRGTISCVDMKDGEVLWRERLPRAPQIFYASPLLAGGVLYVAREDGTLFSAKVEKDGLGEISEVATGEDVIASPVVVDGKLLLRGSKHLLCFE